MKKIIFIIIISVFNIAAFAQENMHPSPAQKGVIAITNAVIHVGNGQVIENGMIVFGDGKILDVRPAAPIADVKVIDARGKHIYPGIIASSTNLGLVEVGAVRATADYSEL